MEKIPCINCNSKLWNHIKFYLEEWDYYIGALVDWEACPLLVLNNGGVTGMVSNWGSSNSSYYNRELITDVEEFLQKAAEIKGFTYKRKDMNNFAKSDLKSGMVVEYRNGDRRLVLDSNSGLILSGLTGLSTLDIFTENLIVEDNRNLDIIKIYCIKKATNLKYIFDDSNLILIKERNKIIELTLQQIANKFNISVGNIRIKD